MTCPVCGGELGSADRDTIDYATGEQFGIRVCRACGLGVTAPQPHDIGRHYPSRYRKFDPLARAVLIRLYDARVAGWSRRLGSAGVALDLGCGNGWMIRSLRRAGWRAFGTERSVEALAAARDLPVFVGDADALATGARFDLVIMFHVLEHLADPVSVLRTWAERLAPGGHLVVAVPNFGSWQARVFRGRWLHLDAPRHLVHFDRHSLSVALDKAGLRVERTSFASMEHDPYGWVQSALNILGFRQNALTRMLVGMDSPARSIGTTVAMVLLAILFLPLALLAALVSWTVGAGALMEVWAVPR
jgi:SAM-dependent methyltransferase